LNANKSNHFEVVPGVAESWVPPQKKQLKKGVIRNDGTGEEAKSSEQRFVNGIHGYRIKANQK
jgi:hypothetical protein